VGLQTFFQEIGGNARGIGLPVYAQDFTRKFEKNRLQDPPEAAGPPSNLSGKRQERKGGFLRSHNLKESGFSEKKKLCVLNIFGN